MFKIHRGSTRLVILCGPVVFKTILPFSLFGFLRYNALRRLYFWKGILANMTEAATWRIYKTRGMSFLTPNYFTCGFFNIQKRERGRHPSKEELEAIKQALSLGTQAHLRRVDSHHFVPDTFLITQNGWRVIDYGEHI